MLDRVCVGGYLAFGRRPMKAEKTAAPMVKRDGAVRVGASREHGLSFVSLSVNIGPIAKLQACARMVKRIKFIERIDRTVGTGQIQKSTLSPNCIVRGPLAVLVYVPKLGELNVLTKPEKLAWLKRLYVSQRNCRVTFSLSRVSL